MALINSNNREVYSLCYYEYDYDRFLSGGAQKSGVIEIRAEYDIEYIIQTMRQ
jgi:hypothetical protein